MDDHDNPAFLTVSRRRFLALAGSAAALLALGLTCCSPTAASSSRMPRASSSST